MTTIRPSGSWSPDRPDATAITRVSAYVNAAQQRQPLRSVDRLPLDRVAHEGRLYDLTLDDLAGLLAIIADLCPDHQACAKCGAVSCETCAVGEPLTDCDPPHCSGDPWCWDGACVDDAARERYYEQQADLTGGRF